MPFVRIELADNAAREQKAGIVEDVTRPLFERLGKFATAVQILISGHSAENYAAAGQRLANRNPTPKPEVARANVEQ